MNFFVKSQVPIISVFMQIYLMPVGLDVPCKKKKVRLFFCCFFKKRSDILKKIL